MHLEIEFEASTGAVLVYTNGAVWNEQYQSWYSVTDLSVKGEDRLPTPKEMLELVTATIDSYRNVTKMLPVAEQVEAQGIAARVEEELGGA